jgi:tetratricopeptide (TPR) repeat protein
MSSAGRSNSYDRKYIRFPGGNCARPALSWLRLACISFVTLFTASLYAQNFASSLGSFSEDTNKSYLLGVALAKQGKLNEAIRTFEMGLVNDQQNRLLLNAIGVAYSLRGDFDHAKRYFLKCLDQDPEFVPALKNLAITYFNMEKYDLAAAEFQKLKAISAASAPIADLFLGMIAERNSNYALAVNLLTASGALVDRYPPAILCVARAEFQLKNPKKAQDILAKLDTAQEVSAAQCLEAAELYLRLGLYSKALSELDKASAKGAPRNRLDYQRALVLDRMSRYREAMVVLSDLGARAPDSNTLNFLAHLALKNGDLQSAMQWLRQAAKLDPTLEDNYLDFSTICADHGNYPVALEAANIGLEHIPNSYRLLVQKGVLLENLARFEEAEAVLQKAAELQKDNSVALLSLAIVQAHSGELRKAEATLCLALQKFPNNYYMHYQLGKIFVQEGNPSLAKHAFQQAIRCNPSFADSYYQLSKLYMRESTKLAEQNLIKCLQLDPNHSPAEYTLARLYLSTGRRVAGQALIYRFEQQRQTDKEKESQKPGIELAQN